MAAESLRTALSDAYKVLQWGSACMRLGLVGEWSSHWTVLAFAGREHVPF